MKRALVGLLVAGAVLCAWAPETSADTCTFCANDLEEGVNPLKCPSCLEIANKITRGNERIWVLDFKQGSIGRVQLKSDTGGDTVENYWFLPYELTNNDDHAHDFFIDITATSDKGNREFRYHDVWIPDVYEEVAKILGVKEGQQLLSQRDLCMPPPGEQNELPRVDEKLAGLDIRAPRTRETGKIALPRIQPKEKLRCVALFEKFDPEMDRLTIKVRGLTNSSIISHDDYVAPPDKPHRRVITEAVLTLHYRRPGDEFAHGQDPIEFIGRRWTDETRTIKSDRQ